MFGVTYHACCSKPCQSHTSFQVSCSLSSLSVSNIPWSLFIETTFFKTGPCFYLTVIIKDCQNVLLILSSWKSGALTKFHSLSYYTKQPKIPVSRKKWRHFRPPSETIFLEHWIFGNFMFKGLRIPSLVLLSSVWRFPQNLVLTH